MPWLSTSSTCVNEFRKWINVHRRLVSYAVSDLDLGAARVPTSLPLPSQGGVGGRNGVAHYTRIYCIYISFLPPSFLPACLYRTSVLQSSCCLDLSELLPNECAFPFSPSDMPSFFSLSLSRSFSHVELFLVCSFLILSLFFFFLFFLLPTSSPALHLSSFFPTFHLFPFFLLFLVLIDVLLHYL